MRPLLPSADAVLPYLRRIDRERAYTNFGPLALELERRLAGVLGLEEGQVACVANGTAGLTLALLACDPRPGDLCALPSWTFEATPAAARLAGLTPWFLDVDPATWALEPPAVEALLAEAPGRVAAVIPVSPFGAPVDLAAWDSFADRTGVHVVVDAAAGFDTLTPGRSPAVVSLHATKAFGIGEGGLVASTDRATVASIRRRSNFGLAPPRQLVAGGFNAKLSEYAAAVGLAALDEWPAKRRLYAERIEAYLGAFSAAPELGLAPGLPAVSSTFNVDLGAPVAEQLVELLRRGGIQARRWWGGGCHAHPALARHPRAPLPVTERLAAGVVGLPLSPDLEVTDVVRVRDSVRAARSELLSAIRTR